MLDAEIHHSVVDIPEAAQAPDSTLTPPSLTPESPREFHTWRWLLLIFICGVVYANKDINREDEVFTYSSRVAVDSQNPEEITVYVRHGNPHNPDQEFYTTPSAHDHLTYAENVVIATYEPTPQSRNPERELTIKYFFRTEHGYQTTTFEQVLGWVNQPLTATADQQWVAFYRMNQQDERELVILHLESGETQVMPARYHFPESLGWDDLLHRLVIVENDPHQANTVKLWDPRTQTFTILDKSELFMLQARVVDASKYTIHHGPMVVTSRRNGLKDTEVLLTYIPLLPPQQERLGWYIDRKSEGDAWMGSYQQNTIGLPPTSNQSHRTQGK